MLSLILLFYLMAGEAEARAYDYSPWIPGLPAWEAGREAGGAGPGPGWARQLLISQVRVSHVSEDTQTGQHSTIGCQCQCQCQSHNYKQREIFYNISTLLHTLLYYSHYPVIIIEYNLTQPWCATVQWAGETTCRNLENALRII